MRSQVWGLPSRPAVAEIRPLLPVRRAGCAAVIGIAVLCGVTMWPGSPGHATLHEWGIGAAPSKVPWQAPTGWTMSAHPVRVVGD